MIPFNLQTQFGPDLKESAVEIDQFRLAKQFLQDQLLYSEDLAPIEKRGKLSLLNFVTRILGQLEEAEEFALEALKISKSTNQMMYIVVDQLRLATTIQQQQRFTEANEMYLEIILATENFKPAKDLSDFAYYQFGKCLFDQKKYNEAKEYFIKALNIRLEKDNPELLKATEFAIEITENKINKH